MIAAMALPAVSTQNMLRWMLFGVLAMGMLSLNTGSGTLAYFTTQVQSNNNTFTAGNLRFNILDSLSTTGQYPSVGSSLSLLNMSLRDATYAPIQLNNVGNLAARYGVKYSTTTVLANNSNGGVIGNWHHTGRQRSDRHERARLYRSLLWLAGQRLRTDHRWY